MASDLTDTAPVIIGIGEIRNKSKDTKNSLEPADLIAKAFTQALQDTGASSLEHVRKSIDSVDVVATWTWSYDDLPSVLSQKVGVSPSHKFYSEHSGCWPCRLLDRISQRIVKGETKVALLAGGEALASRALYGAKGQLQPPGWTPVSDPTKGPGDTSMKGEWVAHARKHGLGAPIHTYPLFENALRHRREQTKADNERESAQLYAEFAQIAATRPASWSYGEKPLTETEIQTVGKKNRMICYPYPLVQNAFNTIDLAGVVLVCSRAQARALGVPESKWVHVWGAGGTQDNSNYLLRPNYFESPSIRATLDATLQASGVSKDQIEAFDIYSCFPVVPKLAAQHLGIPVTREAGRTKPLSLIGGLTSFGGAGNNYSMHALCEMTRQIRQGSFKLGCVLANGGFPTYHHGAVLAPTPRPDAASRPFVSAVLPELYPSPAPALVFTPSGRSSIETYTIEYDRSSRPKRALIIGRTPAGERFVANEDGKEVLEWIVNVDEPIGKTGVVRNAGGQNLWRPDGLGAKV
ncbi:acetyl-CoA acetyltransferase [Gonapodya prolifera JEL478]|uniref:Acetyl-CoA acetyltransferase n=1 Tax=Gonapodya prolifera (strain JEL478) TaxID=1344416 RepID=A0A138ZY89_GONPJ|nr:acetyl-CoA acetyltransferase [Gonapodya prolifera JEL478]|eukprot:KXS09235.1 acetyl-CoA acetyltransferase [Gonapodya prolifera JEL478]